MAEEMSRVQRRSPRDNSSEASPNVDDYDRLRRYIDELHAERQNDSERQANNERQIGELTNIVKAMAEKLNMENAQNAELRSFVKDMAEKFNVKQTKLDIAINEQRRSLEQVRDRFVRDKAKIDSQIAQLSNIIAGLDEKFYTYQTEHGVAIGEQKLGLE